MRDINSHDWRLKVEPNRVITGHNASSREQDGRNGAFLILAKYRTKLSGSPVYFCVICSDQLEWEHVSVHCRAGIHPAYYFNFTPTWDDMCFVKDLFWEPDEAVMQLHPARKDWVNNHLSTLHLWKPVNVEIPMPPKAFV